MMESMTKWDPLCVRPLSSPSNHWAFPKSPSVERTGWRFAISNIDDLVTGSSSRL